MEKAIKLNEAFHNFTEASKSLQTYYERLGERVRHLTQELERKNAQLNMAVSEVRETRDYLQAVLQSIGEAIIVLDQDERIHMINRAAEELLCLESAGVADKKFDDLGLAVESGTSGTRLNVQGRRYDVIFSRSTVTDSDGSVRGYVILIKDITRIKELEQQQERNQRLIAMGEMAAKIVHEIRSPLCSIELFSNMLSDDLKGTQHSEMADGISMGIRSLNNILTNMIFFAKPHKPSFSAVPLETMINESLGMLAALIEERGITLRRELPHATVNGDSELLKQVILNISLNAIHAMPEGGSLDVVMDKDSEFVTVSVIDEGEGIDPDNIEKIFDPFFSTREKGTGLGLAIAHKIMQCHDGFIKASCNEGKGSTFRLYFPVTKDADNHHTNIKVCREM